MTPAQELDAALGIVKAAGYVAIKGKSYRAAQERQHFHQREAQWEKQAAEHARAWARDCCAEERRLAARCEFLYGAAMNRGATHEDLRQPDHVNIAINLDAVTDGPVA